MNMEFGPRKQSSKEGSKLSRFLDKISFGKTKKVLTTTLATLLLGHVAAQTKLKSEPLKKDTIEVSDPNDPRLKAYSDSMEVYNLTAGTNYRNVAENLKNKLRNEGIKHIPGYDMDPDTLNVDIPNDVTGVWGSKIKYSIDKKVPTDSKKVTDNQTGESDFKEGPTAKLLKKFNPAGYRTVEEYLKDVALFRFASDEFGTVIAPSTDAIEDLVDRRAVKKIFPTITDKEIQDAIDFYKDPSYLQKGANVYHPDAPEYRYLDDENAGYKQESITNYNPKNKYSYPIYQKPVQPYVLKQKAPKESKTGVKKTPGQQKEYFTRNAQPQELGGGQRYNKKTGKIIPLEEYKDN